jgi:phage baseplate assembly protein W
LDNLGGISTDKFWLWSVESGNLYFTEIEPFTTTPPTLGTKALIKNNVSNGDFQIEATNTIRGLIVGNQLSRQVSYDTYTAGGTPASDTDSVNWAQSRLNSVSIIIEQSFPNKFLVSYLDTASPPNLNLEELQDAATIYVINGSVIGSSEIVSEITSIITIATTPAAGKSEISSSISIVNNFVIEVDPQIGQPGDEITITCDGNFDPIQNNNIVYFGNILVGQIFLIDTSTIKFIVPDGAESSYIHVETTNEISNYVYFEILFKDIVFGTKKRSAGRFDFGINRPPIYSSDYSINNFSQISDEDNIVQNIYNIILTRPGERIFNPTFGCGIHDLIFNLVESDEEIEADLLNLIGNSIELYEPRARLIRDDAIVDFNKDSGVVQLVLPIELPTGSVREVGIRIGASRNTVF